MKLTDKVEGLPVDMGKLVLSPTRTYAPIIAEVLTQHRNQIHGMVHCSGGAQTKILHFIDDLHIIKDNLFEEPPLFKIIQEQSNTSWEEMYKVFNMGHRLELYLSQEIADSVIHISEKYGVEAQIVGRVSAHNGKKLTIKSNHGEFIYH